MAVLQQKKWDLGFKMAQKLIESTQNDPKAHKMHGINRNEEKNRSFFSGFEC